MTTNDDDPDEPTRPRSSRRRWQISVLRGIPRVQIPYTQLATVLRRVGRDQSRRSATLTVVITDDTLMKDLNRRFRGKSRPTDVLAFPLAGNGSDSQLEGEIYINHDHARRWQKDVGGTLADELTRLAIHGCLHLLGYRHDSPATTRRMASAEDRHLAAAGLLNERAADRRYHA